MTNENTPKKEGGAASALASLFGKKARIPANLGDPEATTSSVTTIPSADSEKKSQAEVIGLGITYSEVGAAEKLGITAEDVTWLRKGILEAGTDYTREAGFVRITTAGIAKIEECIAREDTLIVIASNLPNPKLVLGRRPGEGEILRVRVADSSAWCKGMILPDCRQGADRSGVYTCEARPRFKGRV